MQTSYSASLMILLPLTTLACGTDVEKSSGLGNTSQAVGITAEPAFYVDGQLYRTVATPTELGASQPPHSMDVIYEFGGLQLNVAESAPKDRDYNGGRWQVHALEFADYASAVSNYDTNGSGNFDSAEEIEAAIAAGAATDLGIVKRFVCPVIKLPNRK